MEFVEQPISDAEAETLYDAIFDGFKAGTRPLNDPCDGSYTHTEIWCRTHDVDVAAVKAWAASRGGHCDCEIIFNVAPRPEQGGAG
jgi:hypothetical protein